MKGALLLLNCGGVCVCVCVSVCVHDAAAAAGALWRSDGCRLPERRAVTQGGLKH